MSFHRRGVPTPCTSGGSLRYSELLGPSNGRGVQRSTDAGVQLHDMTNDTQSPPYGMHPDQPPPCSRPAIPTSGSSDRTAAWYAPVEPSPIIRRLRHARAHGRESDGLPGVAESYSGADLYAERRSAHFAVSRACRFNPNDPRTI